MWAVHSALVANDVAPISGARGDPVVKVVGMGGIGKSLLAHEYALRFAAAYPGGVFWLRGHGYDDAAVPPTAQARNAERDTQLLEFARGVGVDVTELSPNELPAVLARFLDKRAEPYLWVVDDLPGHLKAAALDEWLAPGRYGRSLLTTRSRAYEALGAQINLGVLTEQEGLELLAKHRAARGPSEEGAARRLVAVLGHHALALDVAGGALRTEHGVCSYSAYCAALADPGEDELELAASFTGELPGGHEASIATTLARSVRRLDEPGLDFLRLASQLAVEPIEPSLVVEVFARIDRLDDISSRRRAVAGMHETVVASLAETTGAGARQVHTLVSRTVERLERTRARSAAIADAATSVLTLRLRAAVGGRVSADHATLAHGRHLADSLRDEHHAALLHAVASHDFHRGEYPLARHLQEDVLEARRRRLGDEHPETLASMGNLALTLLAQGELGSARALQEEELKTIRRLVGHEHPDTLVSMGNLALTLQAQAELTQARPLQEHVLARRQEVLGDEHPDTLGSINNLAHTLRAQGELAGARVLQERALDGFRRVLGVEHPGTLMCADNLATTLLAQGDLARIVQ